ncbi:ABC transporter ATP-binding protein [Saxibacter everestensis]|uniref:ABC transporter ATP-binding protein n=1 Tax=Saxibacter everestensis TaxID=2909229 RepID=A0ABY8QUL7_9MICO|nr:ABC transporter ATP-binding protein [Brevibacteriaceae bacterium ZFBP1038]
MPAQVRPAAIEARDWGWRHAGRKAFAVRNLDLSVAPGERVLLLGSSGAGKSTLLHALAGVLPDDTGYAEGSLLVDGKPPQHNRGGSGLVLQDPESQVILARVGDDIAFGLENLCVPPDQIWPRVDAARHAVGLDVRRDHPTALLSGGQKQRLALAGVIAMRPGLIVLDEPTANLDPAGVTEVRDAVIRVADATGATLIVVEHRVAVWAAAVDRVAVLGAGGGLIADGSPDVLHEPALRQELSGAGVWLPGVAPGIPQARARQRSRPTSATGRAAEAVLLEASGLSVSRSKRGMPAASGIDVTISQARALGIVGVNGSGKSTLALTLAGLIPARSGSLRASAALARGVAENPIRWTSKQLVTRCGTVFQEPEHQFLTSRVFDELAYGPRRIELPEVEVRARVDGLLDRLRLSRLAEANPFTLSGGEKRRLSVATMLATRPQVLILDEPTFGQDANTWAQLVELMAEQLNAGTSVVAVTHDEPFLDALADERLRLGAAFSESAAAHR